MTSRPRSLSSAAVADVFEPEVAEVAGPAFTPLEAGAAIVLGVLALLISGLMGLLLATLAEEHRLSASGIGLTAMLEALSTGAVTSLAGILIKPVRLRTIAAVATVVLVAIDVATIRASGSGVMLIRLLAGVPEGILLWISIGFISRTATPERWAAALFTGMGLSQLAAATGISALVLPHYGANGGYLVVAASAALMLPVAALLPTRLGAVPGSEGTTSGAPPLRGWIALFSTLCLAASLTAVSIYLVPLARQAGLSIATGRTAVSVSLACQMAGGFIATAIAGRVRFITVFYVTAAVFLATWATYAFHAPAWLFLSMTGLAGVAAFIAGPFLVPMTVEADPSRRAAMQSGAVQLLAGALGPLVSAMAVSDKNLHGALVLGAALQIVGLAVATALHRTGRRLARAGRAAV